MKLKEIDRILLSEIYRSHNGIYAYHFHRKFSIYPSQLVHFIRKYKKLGILRVKGNKLYLTQKGKLKIFENSEFKIRNKRANIFSNIPQEFLQPKLEINSFHVAKLDFF
jgi:hypothetical protein